MATLLDLVKDLARESGTFSASAITTVADAQDRAALMVGWVRKAYLNIQNSRPNWRWMYAEDTAPLTSGVARYTPTALGVGGRFGRWASEGEFWPNPFSIYKAADGPAKESKLRQIDYAEWFSKYGRGVHDAGTPIEWAIAPSDEIVFGPKPDAAYTVHFVYYKSPQTLSADSSEPEMPARYQEIITAEANRLLLLHDEGLQQSQFAQAEVNRIRFELERDQLPVVELGWTSIP